MKSFRLLLLLALCSGLAVPASGGEFTDADLEIALTTDDDWSVAGEDHLALMNGMAQMGAVAHARRKGVAAKPDTAPTSMVPSRPRLITPARSARSSPSAARSTGVASIRAAAAMVSMLMRALPPS